MLFYKAIKDITPEDEENEMVAKKGDILEQIYDEEYTPGEEFILCINKRTGEEAYIEVEEYELYDEASEKQEKEKEQVESKAEQKVEQVADTQPERPSAAPVQENAAPVDIADAKDELQEDAALWESDRERNNKLMQLISDLQIAANECVNCKESTTALRKKVAEFKFDVQKISMSYE